MSQTPAHPRDGGELRLYTQVSERRAFASKPCGLARWGGGQSLPLAHLRVETARLQYLSENEPDPRPPPRRRRAPSLHAGERKASFREPALRAGSLGGGSELASGSPACRDGSPPIPFGE